ncbi:MAG: hypothetical protein ACJ760_08240 [Thermoleophilaceae bacterium]
MRRWQRIALRVVYWLAVVVLSVALLVVLVLLIESRDKSSVKDQGGMAVPLRSL